MIRKPIELLIALACAFAADAADMITAREATNIAEAVVAQAPRQVDGAARPLPKYLHALDFADSYPDAAAEYYRSRNGGDASACASVRDGNTYSRNFDFPFDDRAGFVVKMSAGEVVGDSGSGTMENSSVPLTSTTTTRRYASVGVAQVGTNLTEAIVTSGKPSKWYKSLPGATVDGINENGVVVNINVVDGDPHDYWPTNGTIHCLGAVRCVLDTATNAASAASVLAAGVYFPSGWHQNYHWMIADSEKTYIVENGAAHEVTGRAVMTNFRLYPTHSTGAGQERYALLADGANITNAWFTRCYSAVTNPKWVSEFDGDESALDAAIAYWATKPKEAHRGEVVGNSGSGTTWWQSIHTSVYDISNKTMRIAVQEIDDWYTFQVPSAGGGGVDEGKVREIVQPMIGAAVTGKLDRVDVVKPDVEADGLRAASAKSARHVTDVHSYSEEFAWTHDAWPSTWTQLCNPTYVSPFWSWLIYVNGSAKNFLAIGKLDDVNFEFVCNTDTNLHFHAERRIEYTWDGRYYARIPGSIGGYLTKVSGSTGELTLALPGQDYATPVQVNAETTRATAVENGIIEEIDAFKAFDIRVIDELPEEGEVGVIYLVKAEDYAETKTRDEYLWSQESWRLIGSTRFDSRMIAKTVTTEPIPPNLTNNVSYVRPRTDPVTGETRDEDENGAVVIGKGAVGTVDPNYIRSLTNATKTTYLRSMSVAIGQNARARSADGKSAQAIAIGANAKAEGSNAIAIGAGAVHWYEDDETGPAAVAKGSQAIAIGYDAKATANNALQIGSGTNNVKNSFKFRDVFIVKDGKIQGGGFDTNDVKAVVSAELDPASASVSNMEVTVKSHAITAIVPGSSMYPGDELYIKTTGTRNFELYLPNSDSVRSGLPISIDTELEGVTKLGPWWTNRIVRLPAKVSMKEPVPKTLILEVEEYATDWDWSPVVTRAFETNGAVRIEGTNLHFTASARIGGVGHDVKNPLYGAVSVQTNGVSGASGELIGADGSGIGSFRVE